MQYHVQCSIQYVLNHIIYYIVHDMVYVKDILYVALNPSQTVFRRGSKGAVHPHFSTQAAVIEFKVPHNQTDLGPGELALVGLNHCYIILLASYARWEPQG